MRGRLLALLLPLLLLGYLAGPALVVGDAAADPRSPASPAPSSSTPRTDGEELAEISINGVKPTVVTTATGPNVVVAGTVRNTGSTVLGSLAIRLQRGQPAQRAVDLRTELAGDPATFDINGEFTAIADRLAPGATTGFSLTMPLSGPTGLRITEPGVYPLLVNLNATPAGGEQARVADSRTLLPVLSLPATADGAREFAQDQAGAAQRGLGPDGSVAANNRSPARFTLLWPIAAAPQAVPGRVGAGATDPIVLLNENLSRSLSPGGRLHNLLVGLRPVVSAGADDPRSAVRDSLCLAVDPDLLVTVSAMAGGYAVLSDPANRAGPTKPGTGAAAAADWLAELTTLAKGRCVVALPFAGASLDALHRVGNTALTKLALAHPADLVDSLLDVKSVRGMSLPTQGAITDAGAAELATAAIGTALTGSDTIAADRADPAGQYNSGKLGLATFDRPISAALGAAGSRPRRPVLVPPGQRVPLDGESPVSRRQAALAALAFPSIVVPDTDAGDEMPTVGRSSLIAPPPTWSITPDDAADLVATAGLLLRSGAAVPAPLTGVIDGAGKNRSAARLTIPADTPLAGSDQWWLPSPTAADTIDKSADLTWQLQAALVASPADATDGDRATPEKYMAPLRYDLLRALPGPVDNGVQPDAVRAARGARIGSVGRALKQMRESVSILDPGGRYTQVSERSPLLLVTRNELALPIRVRINTTAPRDFDIKDVGIVEIPGRGTRQVRLPAKSEASEKTSVTFALVSASGVQLGGDPIKLAVNSNAYGKPLFFVTIAAGILLVLLVARRLWHRFRGEPDKADVDRPEASPQDRFLAGRDYTWRHNEYEHAHPHPESTDD
ncbi:MAG: hypothetical protein QM728_14895 [Gordonia sp. (in: high G+C Gram-positive bacteria)]|uniref:DUF6049 family protein n=1 Tax=Gordonia sp. (in: high G+C Gram-positive bacteria) TaxID=84139 RepID=UPI0039E35963